MRKKFVNSILLFSLLILVVCNSVKAMEGINNVEGIDDLKYVVHNAVDMDKLSSSPSSPSLPPLNEQGSNVSFIVDNKQYICAAILVVGTVGFIISQLNKKQEQTKKKKHKKRRNKHKKRKT